MAAGGMTRKKWEDQFQAAPAEDAFGPHYANIPWAAWERNGFRMGFLLIISWDFYELWTHSNGCPPLKS